MRERDSEILRRIINRMEFVAEMMDRKGTKIFEVYEIVNSAEEDAMSLRNEANRRDVSELIYKFRDMIDSALMESMPK